MASTAIRCLFLWMRAAEIEEDRYSQRYSCVSVRDVMLPDLTS